MSRFHTVSTLALVAVAAFAQHGKIASDLEGLDPNATVDVIVQYAHSPTDRHHQRVLAAGGTLKKQLGIIWGAHYAVPAGALRKLAQEPDVVHISPDRPLQAAVDDAEAAVNANIALSYGFDGTGVGLL
ncbi:MAG TPA: hypothetical protein VKT49_18840 [Bryobacteraceae bacterium]|nr:hypothetical protein [Bryobacteraceae bacterium]